MAGYSISMISLLVWNRVSYEEIFIPRDFCYPFGCESCSRSRDLYNRTIVIASRSLSICAANATVGGFL